MLVTGRRRATLAVLAILLVAAGAVAVYLTATRQNASAAASASLTIFTGSVTVRSASQQASHSAATGDRLRQGDEVTTGPATKAAVAFPDGSISRLDANTQLSITRLGQGDASQQVALSQTLGKTWHRVGQLLNGSRFQVDGPNHATAEVRGTEFSVIVEKDSAGQTIVRFDTWQGSVAVAAGGGASVLLAAGLSSTVTPVGQPSQPAPIPPADRTDSWTVFNQTADTTAGSPAVFAVNSLNQGQDTGVRPGLNADGNTDLDYALGWPGSRFELTVYDPDGVVYQVSSSATPPIHIVVPHARAGAWTYRVRDLESAPGEVWWVIVSKTTPAKLAPTPFFTVPGAGTACDHTVNAGATDQWTVAARSAAGAPALSAPGLGTRGRLADNGDGTATLTFAPPSDAAGADIAFSVVATAAGAGASLSCVEHLRARPNASTVAGTVHGPGAGVTVSLDPGGQVALTDAAGTYQFTGLAAGTYTVTVAPPAGWVAAGPSSATRVVDGTTAAPPADFTLAALPAISAVTPSSGPPGGGTSVSVQGVGFAGATQVLFGTAPATSFSVDSDSRVTATAPAQAQGLVVDVRVVTPRGTSPVSGSDRFTYLQALAVTASATPTSVAPGTPVAFTSTVTGGAYPYTYLWDFGDGNTDSVAAPYHTYTAGGRYTATVTVRDSTGQTAGSGSIVVSVAPGLNVTATASPSTGPSPLSTALSAAIGGGVPPYSIAWDFGDGSAAGAGLNVTHVYSSPGRFVATAAVTDATGATQGASVTVSAAPAVLSITPNSGPFAGGTTVVIRGTGFTPSSSVTVGGQTASVAFNSPSQLTIATPVPAAPGTYDVVVTTALVSSPVVAADQFTYAPPPHTSTTSLTVTPAPATVGQPVSLTVAVAGTGGTPSGTVTINDGATFLATLTLAAGGASYTTASLAPGTHPLVATYSGDTSFAASTSATVNEVVSAGTVTVSLSGTPNPSGYGNSVSFAVQVSANAPATGTPTGTVTLLDGASPIGSTTLSGGIATLTYSALGAGTHSLTVQYAGDTAFGAATSAAWSQTVNQSTPPVHQIVLVANPTTINANGTATSTVIARAVDAFGSPATATGTISVAIRSSSSAFTVVTATAVIGAGQQDSSASPAVVRSTTTAGSATISGTSTPAFPVSPASITSTTRAIGLPAEVLAPPGGAVTFAVTVNPAPATPLLLNLSTLDTSVATVTPQVTVPAGATTVNATLTGATGAAGVQHTTIRADDPGANYATNTTVATVEVVNLGFYPGYYQPPATVGVNAQVTLSAAAPASGLRVFLATYSDPAATVPDSSKASVPAFIDVLGGQLASPVFQVVGVAPGTAYLKATGSGVTAAVVTVSVQQAPTISFYVPCCGYVAAGMQRNWYAQLSYNPGVPVTVNLASADPAHLSVPATVTVVPPATSVSFPVTGVLATTAPITITGSAPGWVTGTASSQVSQAALSVSPYYNARTTLDPPNTFTLGVQTPGCGECDALVSPLSVAITVASSPNGNVTAPATVTLPAGHSNTTFQVSQAQNPGTYSVTAADGNSPFTDSVASPTVTVTAPVISLYTPCCGYVAAGMQRNWYVQLSNPAPAGGLAVTLTSSDPAHLAVPTQVTVPGAQNSVAFPLQGVAATTAAATITAATAGWSPGTATSAVATANLTLYPYNGSRTTLDPPNNFVLATSTPGCGQCDALTSAVTATLTLSGTPGIATVPSTATIPAGSSSVVFAVSQANTGGTYQVSASDGNSPFTDSAPSSVVTVTQPSLSFYTPCCGYVAAGMKRTWYVQLSNPAPSPGLAVSLTSSDPAHLAVPASVPVATGQSSAPFTVTGVAPTATAATVTAQAAGWSNATATSQVSTAALVVTPNYSSRTTLDPANLFTVSTSTPGCGQCDVLVASLTATLALTSNPAGITSIPASVTLAAGTNSVSFSAAAATGPGTYSVSASDGNSPLTNSAPSPTVTVSQPVISIATPCCGSVAVGMQRNWYLQLSNPAPTGGLVVNLGSTAPTVIGVPSTVTVPAGANSTNFAIVGSAIGSSTVTASAPGWAPGSASTSTSNAVLSVQPWYTSRTTLDAANTFSLSVQTPACGQCDSVVAATTVNLSATSSPTGAAAVPASVTIPVGTSSVTFTVTDTTVGSYTVTAAPTASFGGGTSPTVSVVQPNLQVGQGCCGTVAAGMHRTFYLSLSNPAPTGGLTVGLASSSTSVATVAASVPVAAGATSASFTVTALSPAPVTITASATGWTSGSLAMVVPTPTFQVNNVNTNQTTSSPPNTGITVSATNSVCACDAVNANVTVTLAIVGTPSSIATVTPTTLVIPANSITSTTTATVSTPTATGTYNVTANAPGFTQGSSPSVTVR